MKITKVLTTSMVLVALIGTGSAWAQGNSFPNFQVLAYAQSVPTSIGGNLTVLGNIVNQVGTPAPIVLDFATNEYTVVISGTLSGTVGITQTYNPTTVTIYEDPAKNANFASPGTFSDGTAILIGSYNLPAGLSRSVFMTFPGTYGGVMTWTGGSRIGDLGGNLTFWQASGGTTGAGSSIPPGYAECWSGKIEQTVVSVEQDSWSAVKQLFQ